MGKKKRPSDTLKTLRASTEEGRCHVTLLRIKVPSSDDWFTAKIHECFAAFLTQFLDSSKELMKSRYLSINNDVYVNIGVVEEKLLVLKN